MSSVKSLIQVLGSKSLRYIMFRSRYELERMSGLLARKFPTQPGSVRLPSLNEWRRAEGRYLFDSRENVMVPKAPSEELREVVKRIESGEVCFFSDRWYNLGLENDWVTNPLTGYHYDINQHWTRINDYSSEAGDIKFVWEPSRFSFIYDIVRNDYHNDEDHSQFVLSRILDWIGKNPLNCGPNYKCSQETSLRVLNWLFALNFYKNSANLTDEIWNVIIRSVYWQIDHVYNNISFSRIAVRNNHAITETLMLYLAGLLFPEFPRSDVWKRKGKKWFEQEIEFQFEPDGCYIQNSMNYQRVVTQLLTLGISLAHKNGESFSKIVYDRAYANLNFLYQCQDETSGLLPNYGANDGALFFHLSSNDYCDDRPQLDALNYVIMGTPLYGDRMEDSFWYGTSAILDYEPITKRRGVVSFPDGGYYLIRDLDSVLFVRCGRFKGVCTPDQLHIDLWKGGENVLMDAGSYLYNTDEDTARYFSGTESHNTVMIGSNDQMRKGVRFVWTDPSDIISTDIMETDEDYTLTFSIKSFKYLDGGVVVNRTVLKKKGESLLTVKDNVSTKTTFPLRQLWHTAKPEMISFTSDAEQAVKEGAYSRYYGRKDASTQIEYNSEGDSITTVIRY